MPPPALLAEEPAAAPTAPRPTREPDTVRFIRAERGAGGAEDGARAAVAAAAAGVQAGAGAGASAASAEPEFCLKPAANKWRCAVTLHPSGNLRLLVSRASAEVD